MKKGKVFLILFTVFFLFTFSCSDDNTGNELPLDSNLNDSEKINKFIVESIEEVYLWESETDWEKYNKRSTFAEYSDHYKLFDELIYKKDDHWSSLTDDIDGLENEFGGVSTTFGYTLSLYRLSSTDDVVAVILYTSPGSPAENAGLKRGDIIFEINGEKIVERNYLYLYYAESIIVRCCTINADTKIIEPLPDTKRLVAVNMYENPVNDYRIIEKDGHKIGYLCYTGYQIESEKELISIFSDFKLAGVEDVVLDLRYNPGGYSRTAQMLSSILAPESEVKNKSVYLEHHYNNLYTNYYKSEGRELNERFIDTLSVNMNLQRLYVLTSNRTASASEATIVGLDPYLDLIQIGGATSGKYCGGILLSPEDIYGRDNKYYYINISNWGMYIMIYRFANIKGISSFTSGLVPDIPAEEEVFNLKPFGDEADPLLGRALAHILNKEFVEQRSVKKSIPVIQMADIKRNSEGLMISTPSSLPILSTPRQISK